MERLSAMGLAALLAVLLCGAVAQEPMGPPPDGGSPDAGKGSPAPLSKEDSELVKDLAVLERLELLKNLELFEDPKPPEKQEQKPQ
jgi:hypothetical protein